MSWESWVLLWSIGHEIEPVSCQQGTEDIPSAGMCCQCLDYLLGCLLPVQAGDVGEEGGAEDENTGEHPDPQACRGHTASARANPASQDSRSRKGMSPRSVGTRGAHRCLLWGYFSSVKAPSSCRSHPSPPQCVQTGQQGDRARHEGCGEPPVELPLPVAGGVWGCSAQGSVPMTPILATKSSTAARGMPTP